MRVVGEIGGGFEVRGSRHDSHPQRTNQTTYIVLPHVLLFDNPLARLPQRLLPHRQHLHVRLLARQPQHAPQHGVAHLQHDVLALCLCVFERTCDAYMSIYHYGKTANLNIRRKQITYLRLAHQHGVDHAQHRQRGLPRHRRLLCPRKGRCLCIYKRCCASIHLNPNARRFTWRMYRWDEPLLCAKTPAQAIPPRTRGPSHAAGKSAGMDVDIEREARSLPSVRRGVSVCMYIPPITSPAGPRTSIRPSALAKMCCPSTYVPACIVGGLRMDARWVGRSNGIEWVDTHTHSGCKI